MKNQHISNDNPGKTISHCFGKSGNNNYIAKGSRTSFEEVWKWDLRPLRSSHRVQYKQRETGNSRDLQAWQQNDAHLPYTLHGTRCAPALHPIQRQRPLGTAGRRTGGPPASPPGPVQAPRTHPAARGVEERGEERPARPHPAAEWGRGAERSGAGGRPGPGRSRRGGGGAAPGRAAARSCLSGPPHRGCPGWRTVLAAGRTGKLLQVS